MKNSVVLIDTNILLNYITNREDPYLKRKGQILRLLFSLLLVHT